MSSPCLLAERFQSAAARPARTTRTTVVTLDQVTLRSEVSYARAEPPRPTSLRRPPAPPSALSCPPLLLAATLGPSARWRAPCSCRESCRGCPRSSFQTDWLLINGILPRKERDFKEASFQRALWAKRQSLSRSREGDRVCAPHRSRSGSKTRRTGGQHERDVGSPRWTRALQRSVIVRAAPGMTPGLKAR
jgi:hypothetical protein